MYLKMTERFLNKNHMLDFILPIEKEIFKSKVIKILVLFSKYFPSYKLRHYNKECKWEDYILENENLKIEWRDNQVYFDISFYYNIDDKLYITNSPENGASIYLEVDQNDQQVCILTFIPNVFTNKNYIDKYDEGTGWSKLWVDQSKSATLNRKILSDFLSEFEKILGTEIIETVSTYINKKYLCKYGIKEEAELEL